MEEDTGQGEGGEDLRGGEEKVDQPFDPQKERGVRQPSQQEDMEPARTQELRAQPAQTQDEEASLILDTTLSSYTCSLSHIIIIEEMGQKCCSLS